MHQYGFLGVPQTPKSYSALIYISIQIHMRSGNPYLSKSHQDWGLVLRGSFVTKSCQAPFICELLLFFMGIWSCRSIEVSEPFTSKLAECVAWRIATLPNRMVRPHRGGRERQLQIPMKNNSSSQMKGSWRLLVTNEPLNTRPKASLVTFCCPRLFLWFSLAYT
jgi:hypothetical protein